MYCKLFASLYQGTLRGRSNEILVFTNLLANCDREGHVDKHWRSIAEEVGISVDQVKTAVANLEAPDDESRSPEHDGARLIKLDGHRAWGWRIVNYTKYRSIKDEEDRREQNRKAQANWRAKNSGKDQEVSSVSSGKQRKPESAHAEAEGDAEGEGDVREELPEPTVPPLVAAWNLCGCFPKISNLGTKRKSVLSARMRDPYFREHSLEAIELISKSDFCTGKNDRGWVANLNWFLRPGKVEEIMEGAFTNRRGNQKTVTDNALKPEELKGIVYDWDAPENQD